VPGVNLSKMVKKTDRLGTLERKNREKETSDGSRDWKILIEETKVLIIVFQINACAVHCDPTP
jgi:hypothetical protein